jgi:transcriptional regulator with GAF, ATPase, and Fis domain
MSAEARLTEEKCRRLEMENARLRRLLQDRHDSSNIVGTSGPARQLRPQIARLAAADTPVLIRARDSRPIGPREQATGPRDVCGVAGNAD